jgi:tRNA(fMet)-specific endonuclease VapC
VNLEDQMRGWMGSIAKERQAARQIRSHARLAELFQFYAARTVVPFDATAAARYDTMNRIKIGAPDRKIAAITLTRDALLLTANRQHFEKVPGLRFENWMG